MRVLHVLCDWSPGGAERLVMAVATNADTVVTVYPTGTLREVFLAQGGDGRTVHGRRGGTRMRALARLVALCREAQIVHTHLWDGHVLGGMAARLAGRPHVATVHNTDPDLSGWRRRVRDAALSRARVLAVSHAVHASLAKRGISSEIVHNGIDLRRFGPAVGGGGILGIGRLVRQKGFDVLLRALPDKTVTILGEGPERSLLASLSEHVHLPGRQEAVPEWLAKADLLVIPSRWEGFGLVAAEGLAAGVPIIASRVDGLPEVLGEAAVYVPPEDPKALRGAILSLLDDAPRAASLRQQATLRAERWSLERTIEGLESIYDTLLSGRKPGAEPGMR